MSIRLGERTRRELHAGGCLQLDAAGDGRSQLHAVRRIDDADLDLVRPRAGVRLGCHLPHAAGGPHPRVVAERDLDQRIAWARPNQLLWNIEYGVAPALPREVHDHLPGAYDLARFGADRRDRARGVGVQGRVAQLILRDAQLRLGRVDLALDGLELLLGLIEFGPGRPPVFHQLLLPPEGE